MATPLGRSACAACLLVSGACGAESLDTGRVRASYDPQTGKLTQLVLDAEKNGKPDIYSYMDGSTFVRIEIDRDEDGKIDRWEYYGDDQKVVKVGISRSNDGRADAWIFQSPDGPIARMEIATRRDGKPNRFEYFEKGTLARAEQDTNGDGRIDKWETYKDGVLATAGFDTKGTGSPDAIINYDIPAK